MEDVLAAPPPIALLLGVAVVSLLVIYVLFMSRQDGVFRKLHVPGPAPWPAVGNFPEVAKLGVFNFQREYFNKYAGHKVYGYFDPGCPIMVVRDLDLVRDVTIKHFNKFVNRRPFFTLEKPFDRILTALKDDHWRHVRQTISRAFTSGKLRNMFPHVESSARSLSSNLLTFCESGDDIELRDIISCYTMDVIASAGFGFNINSVKDRSSPFAKAAKKIVTFSGKVVSFVVLFPPLVSVFVKMGWTAFDKESVQILRSFVGQAIDSRKHQDHAQSRHDFLQLLVDAEKTDLETSENCSETSDTKDRQKTISRTDIEAQAIIFLLASFDTVSSVLSFGLFAIAHHPDVCAKIQQELDTVLGDGGTATYDKVQDLVYLDQCVNEFLRMFTPVIFVDRVCTEECDIGDVHIPKGMVVMLPVFAIHRDSKHWPNPDTFNPDRFKAENKEDRHPFAHMAFGHGPRNCIGMRLAMLQMKLALAAILQVMTPVPCGKSVHPPRLSKYQMIAQDGLWVKMTTRERQ